MKNNKTGLPHYYVNNGKYNVLFLQWDDAFEYCEINNLNINLISKSYSYDKK
tara:strand:- start:11322 stop:11477 length:156 start_codon:yes stop_codon:yes gene_type:complete